MQANVIQGKEVWNVPIPDFCPKIPIRRCAEINPCQVVSSKKKGVSIYACVNKDKHSLADYDEYFGADRVHHQNNDWAFDWDFEKPYNSTLSEPEVVPNPSHFQLSAPEYSRFTIPEESVYAKMRERVDPLVTDA